MSTKPIQILSPVGRMIGGSLYQPKTTNQKGEPLIYKTGAKKGQPRNDFNFGVAFPKTPGATHFAHEQWLAPVYTLAQQAFPAGHWQRDDFSWKITDGDSQKPNKNMKRPCDQEGYPGHWVIWFSGTVKPRTVNANGTQPLIEPDAIKPGYYVQVCFTVDDNQPSETPGMYFNHLAVALSGYGEEIIIGPDPASLGFGAAPLPPGASVAPIAAMVAAPVMPGTPVAPLLPNLAPVGSVPVQPAVVPTAAVAPTVPVVPNPAILTPPVVAPTVPVRRMTAAAQGATYEQMVANGWNDALLIQHQMMLP